MTTLQSAPWFANRSIVARTRHIARVLTRHGLGDLVNRAGLRRFAPFFARGNRHAPGTAERIRLALGELGVAFIKLGQMLSTRADLVPPEFLAELSKLQDAAPPVPFDDVAKVVAEDLGAPPETLFLAFHPEPLASASIGQVHAATLADGTPVVVKVRRPGVIEEVERDLEILDRLAHWVEAHSELEVLPIVSEFAYTLRNELDYLREGDNAERLRKAFEDDPTVWIPRVYWEWSSRRVLTLERVGGIKVSDTAALERLQVSRRQVAQNAVRMFLREVLELGFFHADPHPGNFFVQPDGSIAVVDFGMVGRVSEPVRDHLLRAGLAVTEGDAEALAEELFALGVAGPRASHAAFTRDLDHLLGRYSGRSVAELSAAAVTRELYAIAFRHRLQLPAELAVMMRVVAMSEGLGLLLDPEFRYMEFAAPIVRGHWHKGRTLRAGVARLGRAAAEAADLSLALPRRAGRLLGRVERGELELNVRHEGLERLSRDFQGMTNRLALALLLAASVVALSVALGARGALGIQRELGTLFTFGLVFSLAFGLWLVVSILRAGRR